MALAAGLLAGMAPLGGVVAAQERESPEDGAGDLWREAQAAEDRADPAAALETYRALVETHPSHRLASRARRRIAALERRSAGGLEPLAKVMAVREDPTAEAVTELEGELESFPAGRARREARSLVGSSWLRLGQPERAAVAYERLLAEPELPEGEATRARLGLARALQAGGDPEAALRVLQEGGEAEGELARALVTAERSRMGTAVAVVVIALFLVWLAWRTGLRPFDGVGWRHGLLVAWVLLVPLLIARQYDAEATDTFLLLALVSAPVLFGAAALGKHARGRRDRLVGAVGAVAAEVAVGYLVLVERGAVLGVGP